MKTVRFHADRNRSDNLLHVETDGCVVNIRVGLTDDQGRKVTVISVSPDDESRGGDGQGGVWHVVDQGQGGIRVARQETHHDKVFFDSMGRTDGIEYGNAVLVSGGDPIEYTISRAKYDTDYPGDLYVHTV